jgi:hypothetical protein
MTTTWRGAPLARITVSAAAVLVLAAGCAVEPATVDAPATRLLGQPLERALDVFGPERRREPLEGGAMRYHWRVVEELLDPGGRGPPSLGVSRHGTGTYAAGKRQAPRLTVRSCDFALEVDAGGLIAGWMANGDACAVVLRARLQ